jgi:hypothetical protein
MLLDGAAAALPEEPPEEARDVDVDPVLLGALDRLPEPPPEVPPEVPLVDGPPPAEPVGDPPLVVLAVAAAAGVTEVVGDTADPEVPVPSVTMPFLVTLPGVAAVCASAGKVAAMETSTAQRTAPIMAATQPASGIAAESADNQRGDRDPDGPPKPN